jgi:hypothetical protein
MAMTADATRASRTPPGHRSAVLTLLRGRGSPRLYLGALLAGLVWSLLIVFIYPYALDIAGAGGNLRFLGLVLLLLVGFAVYRALRAFGRVLWHLGLVWLAVGLLIVILIMASVRLRADVAGTWPNAARAVIVDAGAWLTRGVDQLAVVPSDIYIAATGQAPPWRPKPTAVLDPVTLDRVTGDEQVVLLSESQSDGITRGALVQIVAKSGQLSLRAGADANSRSVGVVDQGTLMVIVDGPRKTGDMVWWKVSAPEREGWCAADALALVSR